MGETDNRVSQWWDIRATNGDLLARIKAPTYDSALQSYVESQERRTLASAGSAMTQAHYSAGFDWRAVIYGTVH